MIILIGSSPRAWGTLPTGTPTAAKNRFIPTRVGNTRSASGRRAKGAVHPHARGEHRSGCAFAGRIPGSSPRAWGTPPPRATHPGRHRFIPTRVGNTLPGWFARGFIRGSSPRAWGTRGGIRNLGVSLRFIPTRVGNTFSLNPAQPFAPVHPHARGEHLDCVRRIQSPGGSSPRAWGTHHNAASQKPRWRFIPTRVGNTPTTHGVRASWPVHPHARGEHFFFQSEVSLCYGSSPRAWGTLVVDVDAGSPIRFIPTRVGNTKYRSYCQYVYPVHPHARGEHQHYRGEKVCAAGSSPRAWGTHDHPRPSRGVSRFIPTRVGNTHVTTGPAVDLPVHPHARGEHSSRSATSCARCGSSPRAWGTLRLLGRQQLDRRFIPTRVGNTRAMILRVARTPVHPHARGEHSASGSPNLSRNGSSPRAWGTHQQARHARPHRRFIPTRVGNTSTAPRSLNHFAVHPHARGEHVMTPEWIRRVGGSSPRAWGTLQRQRRVEQERRFIPTRVGNTPCASARLTAIAVHPHARGEHSIRPNQ